MGEWAKVVTQPLGVVGFCLFLLFGYLAKVKSRDERRWLSPVAVAFAAIALVGGLALAYLQVAKLPPPVQTSAPPAEHEQEAGQVRQSSSGDGSPNVQGVQGDVDITVGRGDAKATKRGSKIFQKPAQASQ